ncbi:hypothetical protein ABH994_000366 [Bradyrhizobium yuanmingense]|uniref:hypothetical protein n=1 Tax=Bradyrhizobium yuanmingense TaxID=108015 RepID=UPI0035148813
MHERSHALSCEIEKRMAELFAALSQTTAVGVRRPGGMQRNPGDELAGFNES